MAFFAVIGTLSYFGGKALLKNLGTVSKAGTVPDPQVVDVLRSVDADTLEVRYFSGYVGTVRLIGLDVPKKRPNQISDCFARESLAFSRDLVTGERLRLVSDRRRHDSAGRLLAYAYRTRDGIFINEELISKGFAIPVTTAPNVLHSKEFRELARTAQSDGVGLWSKCRNQHPAPTSSSA